jgi:threonine synthase
MVADAPDPEIVDSIRLLAATEGIFGETAAGVTIAVLRRLLAAGKLDPDQETVIINSGDGLKTLNAVAGATSMPEAIKPSLAAFTRFYDSDAGQALRHCA